MQEDLRDRRSLAPRSVPRRLSGQVEQGQAGHVGKRTGPIGKVRHDGHDRVIRAAVAQGLDCRGARCVALVRIDRSATQELFGDAAGCASDGFDEAGPRVRIRDLRQGTGETEDHLLRSGQTPPLQSALGEHPGESAVRDHPDQIGDAVQLWRAHAQRPGGMLPEKQRVAPEQGDEHLLSRMTADVAESVDRGDGAELVSGVRRRSEDAHRPRAAISARSDGQAVGSSYPVED